MIDVRSNLGLSQAELGALLGVSAATISKWECGRSSPSPWHTAILMALDRGLRQQPKLGGTIQRALVADGIARALFLGLQASQP